MGQLVACRNRNYKNTNNGTFSIDGRVLNTLQTIWSWFKHNARTVLTSWPLIGLARVRLFVAGVETHT